MQAVSQLGVFVWDHHGAVLRFDQAVASKVGFVWWYMNLFQIVSAASLHS
jgi:hypothetical protein